MGDNILLFLVRAGKHGEQEEIALSSNIVTIAWNELPDLSGIKTRDDLRTLFEETYPDASKGAIANNVGQIWTFINRITSGDLVALPLKAQSAIAFGKVTGKYSYRKDLGNNVYHTIPVTWIKTDIARTIIDQDLLYSFGAFMTVCQIERNDAEQRIKVLLNGKYTPTPGTKELEDPNGGETPEPVDLEQIARDQIMTHINQKFVGHDLARLVEAVLQAQGYVTRRSDPGPDGGIDILAGGGPMGFDHPKISVQVKSQSSPADVNVLRSLQGASKNFGSDQALLVCWGGFNRAVQEEARRNFFSIRLWDSGHLIEEVLKYYDKFPDTLKAELPLKRVWALVVEDDL